MNHISRAIETTGTVEEGRKITLDQPLPEIGQGRVRVIVFLEEESDVDEDEWLRVASVNAAHAFLADEPDLYTLADGKPFHDEGLGAVSASIQARIDANLRALFELDVAPTPGIGHPTP